MNGPTHAVGGIISGGTFALYRARNQAPSHRALEGIGGALAGLAGGKAPDSVYLDPSSLGPRHRRFGHSWTVLAGGIYIGDAVISGWEKFFRRKADEVTWRLATDPSLTGWARIGLSILECLWRVAAGALAGFIAGYTSHLVLDAFTTSSLPLLGLDIPKFAGFLPPPNGVAPVLFSASR